MAKKQAPITTTTVINEPASPSVGVPTNYGFGILNGRYTTFTKEADGQEKIWTQAGIAPFTPYLVPAGTVTHPILGTGSYLAHQVWYWVRSDARKIVYEPEQYFGVVLP